MFIDEGVLVKAGARIGPHAVIGRQTQVEEEAIIERSILWPNCRIGNQASIADAVLGRQCHIGRNVSLNSGAVLETRRRSRISREPDSVLRLRSSVHGLRNL